MRALVLGIFLCAASAASAQTSSTPAPASRPVIRVPGDLPPIRYRISEPPSRYVFTGGFLTDLLPRIRTDAEALIASSDFVHVQLRRQISSSLAAIALLQGRPADAERFIAGQRAVETQPQLRRLALLNFDALAAVVAAPGGQGCAAGARRLAERLSGADPVQARQEVAQRWSQVELTSRAFDGAGLQGADRRAASGSIDLLDGLAMARIRAATELLPPCRAELARALRAWLDASENAEPDIWAAREPAASLFIAAAPVTVAIWDTGLDYSLFADRLARDPAEPLDGRDNDRNGVVDDVHGPTFDGRMQPSFHPMQPLSEPLAERYFAAAALAQGEYDHRLGIDSAAARLFTLHARTASAEEQAIDVRLGGELNYRRHGTFVGSQVAEGLAFVRLYNVRMIPAAQAPDPIYIAEPENERWIAQLAPTIRRMRAAGVRVVNMSWSIVDDGGQSLLEGALETDPARARQRSRAMYERFRDAMAAAIAAAPDILFVVAAGNDGSRNEDIAPVPDSLPLPNILVVGAVGPGGAPASFTSFGERVRLYSRGQGATGRAPGGGLAHAAGTSMAAPLVVRTAAQMIAVNPRLRATELIEGMLVTATPGAENIRLVHPAAAVAWAQERRR